MKLLLLLTGLTVLPLVLTGYSLWVTNSAEIKRGANDTLLQNASNLAHLIDQTYTDTWIAPLALARDTLDNRQLSGDELNTILAGVTNLPDIVAVELVNGNGTYNMQLSSRDVKRFNISPLELRDLLGIPWNTVAAASTRGDAMVSDVRYNAKFDFWSVVIALPLKHDPSRTVLAARISLDGVRRHLNEQVTPELSVTLVDDRGVRLLDAARAAPSGVVFHDIRASLNGHRQGGVRSYARPSGQTMLAAFSPLSTMNWAIVTERTEASAYLRLRATLESLALWLAVSLGIALVGARLAAVRISRPILDIVSATADITDGKFDVYIEHADERGDEIGTLGKQINDMAAGLRERERIKDIFGRYQTVEVMQTLLGDPTKLALGGEMRCVTIMMTDLRGFTAAAGRLPPDQVLSMLNNYFEVMVGICGKHNGTIIEILGDALLVLFGAPMPSADHATRAVACAIEMQNAMQAVNQTNARAGLPQLEMGIGLNTGDVVVGNIGSAKRAKYGVVGTHVNLASRIESYTVGGQVLVSQAVVDAAGACVHTGSQREVEAKGLNTPLKIVEVTGIGGAYDLHLSQAQETLVPLAAPLALGLFTLEGKDIAKAAVPARLMKMSAHRGVIETQAPLAAFKNIKLNAVAANLAAHDVYAKVLEEDDSAPNTYVIHFTAVPQPMQTHFNQLLHGERPVAHHKPPPAKGAAKAVPMRLVAPAKVDR